MAKLAPDLWITVILGRMKQTRIARGLRFCDIEPSRERYAAVRIELQGANLLFDVAIRLCQIYSIRPDRLLDVQRSSGPWTPPPPERVDCGVRDLLPRTWETLKARRLERFYSGPDVSMAIWGTTTNATQIYRIEQGKAPRSTARRVYELCYLYDLTFAELFGFTQEGSK
jgi:hypothetical protein